MSVNICKYLWIFENISVIQLWSSWFMLSCTFWEVAKVGRSNSIRGKDGKRDLILWAMSQGGSWGRGSWGSVGEGAVGGREREAVEPERQVLENWREASSASLLTDSTNLSLLTPATCPCCLSFPLERTVETFKPVRAKYFRGKLGNKIYIL